jgi:hypothetical protein
MQFIKIRLLGTEEIDSAEKKRQQVTGNRQQAEGIQALAGVRCETNILTLIYRLSGYLSPVAFSLPPVTDESPHHMPLLLLP